MKFCNESLISDLQKADSYRQISVFATAYEWKKELLSHPERFVMCGHDLLWDGNVVCFVPVINDQQDKEDFWNLLDKMKSDLLIQCKKSIEKE